MEPAREPSPDPSSERDGSDAERHEQRRQRRHRDDEPSHNTRDSSRDRRRRHRDESPGSDTSEATIELPPRFDEHGRQTPDDPLADTLESILSSIFL